MTNIVIDVPTRDGPSRSRRETGTQKLKRTLDSIHASLGALRAGIDRAAEVQARARAIGYLTNPPPEVQAIRDRAAFDQAWRDRTERQRQQNRARQEAADKFFGRITK